MLTSDQINVLGDTLTPLFQYLEHEVIVDIARRIDKTMTYTRTAELMAMDMQRLGYSPAKIRAAALKVLQADKEYQRAVEQNTLEYKKAVEEIIKEIVEKATLEGNKIVAAAGNMSWVSDMSVWESNGKELTDNSFLKQLKDGIAKQTVDEMINLTQTTGFKTISGMETIKNAYRNELDKAVIKICSGTFSQQKVVEDVIHNLAKSGLRSIDFDSRYSMQLDTAVKLAVRTGCGQISAKIEDENILRSGENLVYVSKHWGARNEGIGVANHEQWQGQVYFIKPGEDYSEEAKRIGQDRIMDIWYSTGYSPDGSHVNNPLGMHGYNCRHIHGVFFEGLSSIPDEQPEPGPFKVNGKEYDYYKMTQKLRSMEREIRALKREKEARDALRLPNTHTRAKIEQKTKEYYEFCKKCKVPENTTNLNYESGTSDITKTKAYKEYKKQVAQFGGAESENGVREISQAKTHGKKVEITDIAIDKVKKIELSGYSDGELTKLQEKHKELLTLAKNNNDSNEVVNMFSTEFGETITTYGNEKSVLVSENPDARAFMMKAKENSVIWVHNHPKGSTFSYEDIASFMQPQIRTFSVVTNQGKIYCLNKTNVFSLKGLYDRINVLRDTYKGKEDYQELIMKDLLKEIDKYGVEYIR